MKARGWRRLAAGGAALLCGSAASAQQFGPLLGSDIPFQTNRGENTGVLERPRPEYDPIGIHAGAFTILPQARLGVGYSSNPYGATTGKRPDAFFLIEPSITAKSDWSRHSLSAVAGAELERFAKQTVRNQTGLYAQVNGQLDVVGTSNIVGQAGIRRDYEQQYSGSFPTASVQPVQFVDANGMLRGTHEMGRFRFTLSSDVHDLTYSSTRTATGAIIDQNFRDRDVYRTSGRVEYGVTPDTAAFVQAGYSRTNYKQRIAGLNDNRDGDEVRLLGGMTFDLTALIRAAVGAGYMRRTYDSARFATLAGFAYDVQLSYFPTELTTVSVNLSRAIEDSILNGSSGYFSNTYRGRVDHELLRNLLLFVAADYEHDSFQSINRVDNLLQLSTGANYYANRGLVFDTRLQYIDRRSSGTLAGQVFKEWRGTVAATFRY